MLGGFWMHTTVQHFLAQIPLFLGKHLPQQAQVLWLWGLPQMQPIKIYRGSGQTENWRSPTWQGQVSFVCQGLWLGLLSLLGTSRVSWKGGTGQDPCQSMGSALPPGSPPAPLPGLAGRAVSSHPVPVALVPVATHR